MKKVILTMALCLLTMVFAVNSFAAIIDYDHGTILQENQAGKNLGLNQYQSDTLIKVFDESQNVILEENLYVDHLVSSGGTFINGSALNSDVISGGIRVHSHLIHFDPINMLRIGSEGNTFITFSEPILGLICYEAPPGHSDPKPHSLTKSDGLGLLGTTFSNVDQRGIENFYPNDYSDTFEISRDLRTLTVNLYAGGIMDEIRVITAVPIPGAIWLLGSCMIGLLGIKRRIRR